MKRRVMFALPLVISTVAFAVEWKKDPHLERAAEQIKIAKQQLAQADDLKKTEFGGHRVKAMELLTQAELEVIQAAKWAESDAK